MSRKYVYGVIPSGQELGFGPLGLGGGAEVRAVPYQSLSCVVSAYLGRPFSALTKEELVRHLLAHQTVCEHVMRQHTILPIKVGTLLEGEEEVRAMLQQGYTRFSEALARMEGKAEFEVAATWELARVYEEISRDSEISKLKEAMGERPSDGALEDRVLLGKMVKDSLDRRRDEHRRRMVDFLRDVALDFQENALLRDELVMNVALLVQRAQEGDLTRRTQELNDLFHDEMEFRIIGPLPPYSFSTVQVSRAIAEELEQAREVLGLETEVNEDDVHQAYRTRVAVSHPDVNPLDHGAEERVNQLRQAARLLTEYCQGRSANGAGDKARVSLLPEAAANTFVISIKRTTPQAG